MANENVTINFKAIADFSDVNSNIQKLGGYFSKLKLPNNLGTQLKNNVTELQTKFSNLQKIINGGVKTKADFSAFEKAAKEVDAAIASIEKGFNKINDKHIEASILDTSRVKTAQAELNKFSKTYSEMINFGGKGNTNTIFGAEAVANFSKLVGSTKGLNTKFTALKDAFKTGDIEQINQALEKMIKHVRQYQESFNNTKGFGGTRGDDMLHYLLEVQRALPSATSAMDAANRKLEEARQISSKELNLNAWKSGFQNFAAGIDQAVQKERQLAQQTMSLSSQLSNLQTSANYFFGLQNMFNLMRRGLRETLDTVKELDKAMTETAVVTDYKVSDMWNMLPDYTELANKLGATIQGSYETMTLYFQQGLDKNATFEIGEETMKMARIAGLDYAETTNMMTAALRGFNMELNQTSAKRVNDVYSKLAAITASDTKELGLAMERTASIAHSANMDFGTTTAFLAQMIETTREAPENLGTAMKTIIARFQELKENPMEIGEVDGEEVSFNRVDKALKTIGVQLVDSKDKFRDLDDVFLDIAEKWDGLTQTQQRYIATTAAGSRQQSRFIAMMANYKRTIELVDAAANSEGASDVQFSKTLDSMEAKLNALSNAWKTFLMGIANNNALKGVVDIGTEFITFIDKAIDGISKWTGPFEGFTKSLLSLGVVFGSLKLGGAAVNKGLGFIGNLVDPQGSGGKMFGGMTGRKAAGNAQLASQINSPIVSAINNIYSYISKGSPRKSMIAEATRGSLDRTTQARKELSSLMTRPEERLGEKNFLGRQKYQNSAFSLNQVSERFKGLDSVESRQLYNSSPILKKKIEETFAKATSGLSKRGQEAGQLYAKYISQGISSGELSINKAFSEATQPLKIAENVKESMPEVAQEIREQVRQEAFKKENFTKEDGRRFMAAADRRELQGEERKQFIREAQMQSYSAKQGLKIKGDQTMQLGKIEGGILKVGTAASTAGQSVQGLGMALSSMGMTTAGGVLNTIGSGIMGIGMAAEGAAAAASAMGTSLKAALIGPQGVILGLVAGIAAIGIAIAKVEKDRVKEVRKAAKEIEDTYTKTTEKTTRNLSKLDEYKSDFERLSKGVDSNGYNIDLGTEEYKDYQKIVKDLVKMNPELVEGYNAQGQAIIDKNRAIEESIKVQQREQKEAEDEYIKASSLTKLINSRNTTKRYDYGYDKQMGGTKVGGGAGASESVIPSQFETDAFKIVNKIKALGEEGETVLKDLGKQYNVDFLNLNEAGIKALQDHGSEMMDYVTENITTASEEQLNAVQDSIATLGKHTKGFEEVVKPVYENLSTYISKQQVFKDIPEEFRSVLDSSIKEIAGKKYDANGNLLTGSDMQKMARDAAAEIQNLKGHAGEYESIMQDVSAAQEEYGRTLNASQYNINTKDAISQLEELKKEFDSGTSETDRAMSEWVNNQIEKVKNFTQEGEKTLAEGFNHMTAQIDSVNKAYERYQEEGKKGDYYTGSDNLKQIYDDATSEKNWAGNSQSMYRAAFEILGEDNVVGKSAKKVKAELKEVGKYLTEDRDGVDLFLTDLRDKFQEVKLDPKVFKPKKGEEPLTIGDFIKPNDKGGLNFEAMRNFDNTQMESMATSLGLSLDTFTALLNKARQFYNIDFSNIDSLRQTLAASETSLTGQLKTQKDGEKRRTLYTKRDDFRQEALLNGVAPDKLDNIEKQMAKQGTVFMKSGYEMTRQELSKYFKDWGISDKTVKYRSTQGTEKSQIVTRNTTTADQFVKNLSQLGYSPEEIKAAYEVATDTKNGGKQNLITDADTANIDKIIQAQQEANDPVVSRVETTNTILSDISSKLDIANGVLSSESEKKYEKINSKEYKDKIRKEGYGNENKYKSSEDYAKAKNVVDKGVDETGLAIKELEAMRKNATDSETKETIDKLLKGLREDHDSYVKKQKEMEQGWETKNKEGFEKSGLKVKNETDKQTLQTKYGVDLNNIMSQSASVTSVQQFAKLISGLSTKTQKSLNQQYVSDKWADISKMNFNDLNSFYKALGPLDQATEDKLTQAIAALDNNTKSQDKNSQSNDKNSQSQDKNTKSNEDNSKSNDNNSKAKEKDSKPKNKATRQPVSQKEQVEAGRQRRQSNQSSTPTKPNFKVDFKSFGLGNLLTEKANQRQQRQEQSKKNESSGLSKILFSLFKSKATRQGPLTSGGGQTSVKTSKKSSGDGVKDKTVTVKAKTSGQAAVTKLKNAISKIKSKTAKVKAKVSGAALAQKLKTAISKVKSKTVKVKADVGDSISKVTTLKEKRDSLKDKKISINVGVNSSGLSSAVRNYDKLQDKEVTVTVNKKVNTSGGKKGTGAKGINNKISSQSYNISSAAKGKDNEEDLKEKKIKGKFDSAAKGKRGKGGMTLTGELGYEVAWFPSENRSTILGLDGPEMVKLPNDAVVYNHKQSKKIVAGNKNRPNVGSMVDGDTEGIRNPGTKTKPKKKNGKGSRSSGSNNNDNNKTNKKNKKTAEKWSKAATIWMRVIGKVDSWWDNISRKIEATRRTFDQSMKTFNKVMSSPVVSINTVFEELKKASKTAANAITQQIKAYEKARDKLLELDTGKPLTKTDKANKKKLTRYEQLKKKGKKRTKKENKEFKKLRKWGRSKGFINKKSNKLTTKGKTAKNRTRSSTDTSISYERTGYNVSYKRKKGKGSKKANKKRKNLANAYKTYLKYKKDNSAEGKKRRQKALAKLRKAGVANKKGKLTKKGKKILKASKVTKTQTDKVNLAKYIKFDKQTGAYVIDDAAINNDNESNKKRGQAIRDKANELLEEYTQKRNDALDALADFRDQFVDVGDQIYEKFYSWKSALEEIELVTQRIAEIQAKSGVATAYQELISNQILTGITKISLGLGNVNSELEKTVRSLTDAIKFRAANNEQLITKARTNRELESNKLERTYSDTDEENAVKDAKEEYDKITNRLNVEAKKYGVNADENGLGLVWGADLYGQEIAKQQAALRKYEAAQQEQIITVRAQEILGDLQKREDGTYAFGNSDSEIIKKIQEMESDTSLTNELKDAIQTRVQELQEGNSKIIQTVTDELEAANDTLKLVFEMQEYLADIEQKIGQVLVERDQRVVDNLSKINDSIKNTTTKILDGVRESLDKRRQQDSNAKTEKSIQDKQFRLAYLQNDSAGGHQVEIAQLRKEIGDEQQGYRETLEDQLLSNLQKQADQAAAQRERQISLLQTQIEYNKQNGIYAKQINDWLSNPVDYQTEIHDALTENDIQDKFKTSYTTALSEANVNDTMVKVGAYIDSIPAITEEAKKQSEKAKKDAEKVIPKGSITAGKEEAEKPKINPQPIPKTVQKVNTKLLEEEATKQAAEEKKQSAGEKYAANLYMRGNASDSGDKNWGKIGKDKLQEQINLGADLGKDEYTVLKDLANTDALTWKQVLTAYKNLKGKEAQKSFSSFLNGSITKAQQNAYQEVFGGTYKTTDYNKKIANAAANKKIGKAEFESIAKSAQEIGIGARTYMQDLANATGLSWKQVIKAAKDAGYSKYRMAISFNTNKFKAGYDAVYGKGAYAKNLKKAKKDKAQVYEYKTGGLADYTGPAWMDGTKSKPELVLNAQDTKNFIALKDTLGQFNTSELRGASTGDLNFDIDINVDKIDNDYDVRRIVDVVKKEITKNAGYRNVKIVRNMK